MATFLIDGSTELPENGDAGWGTTLNAAVESIDQRFTWSSGNAVANKALASGITGTTLASNVVTSSLTTVGTLTGLSVSGNVTVTGDLTINGTTTTINTTTLNVSDNLVVLNNDVTGSPTENAGIEVERGTSTNVQIRWNETSDKWELTNDGSAYGDIITTGTSGAVTSAMIADGAIVNADVNASAAIALSKLASGTGGQVIVANSSGVPTFMTLSGDVSVSNAGVVSIAANSVALGTDTTGNYVASLVAGTGVTLSNNSGEGATPTIAIGQAVGTASSPTFAGVTSGNMKFGVDANFISTTTGGIVVRPVDATSAVEAIGESVSIGGADSSGTGVNTAGAVSIYGGYASGGTVNNGGIVQIDGGYGSDSAGYVNIGAAYASAVTIGHVGIATTIDSDLTVSGTTILGPAAVETQSTSYTLVLDDQGKVVEMNNSGSNVTVTVPPNSAEQFPVGAQITVIRKGTGTVDFAAGSGVTLFSDNSKTHISTQFSAATLIKRATNEWYLIGNLSAS